MKFTRGFKATIKCGLPLVSCARESSYLSWCIPSKFRKYQSCNRQTSSEFVKFLICFHNCLLLFLSTPVDDDFLMCKRSMRLNRFIVIAQALDQFPPFLFLASKASRTWDPNYTHVHCLLLLVTLLSDLRTMSVRSQLPQLLCEDGV